MADLISAFKSELFRPLVTLVIPGAVAAGPLMIVSATVTTGLSAFLENHEGIAWTAAVGIAVATGLVLENIGSWLEDTLIDRWLQRSRPRAADDWPKYLALRINDEYVGQRYLRTILVRMKFELAMAPASMLAGVGLSAQEWVRPWGAFGGVVGPTLLGVALGCWFMKEATNSAGVLADTRAILVDAVAGGVCLTCPGPLQQSSGQAVQRGGTTP